MRDWSVQDFAERLGIDFDPTNRLHSRVMDDAAYEAELKKAWAKEREAQDEIDSE